MNKEIPRNSGHWTPTLLSFPQVNTCVQSQSIPTPPRPHLVSPSPIKPCTRFFDPPYHSTHPPFLSQICSGLLPMLYRMDRKPDWKVFLNISHTGHPLGAARQPSSQLPLSRSREPLLCSHTPDPHLIDRSSDHAKASSIPAKQSPNVSSTAHQGPNWS